MLYLDYETYCELPIKAAGAYKYVYHESFRPLLLAAAWDDEPVVVHDYVLGERHWRKRVTEYLQAGGIVCGFGQFDRLCLHVDFDILLPPERYVDAMALASLAGLPRSLDKLSRRLEAPLLKDTIGKKAINTFCKPVKGKRLLPEHNIDLWNDFVKYAGTDVELLRYAHKELPPMSKWEKHVYAMDMRMNQRGIGIDVEAAQRLQDRILACVDETNQRLSTVTRGKITRLGQVARIKDFVGTDSASEAALTKVLPLRHGPQYEVAKLRLDGAKSSTKKIKAMLDCTGHYSRSRGTLAYAATHTKRWAGQLFQPQNLPRDCYSECEFDSAMERCDTLTLSEISKCIRPLIVPEPGNALHVYDYASIEIRVLCWYAKQEDILKLFEQGDDLYKEMASSVFKKPIEKISKDERFIGKTLVLGCGYGLGAKSLKASLERSHVYVDDATASRYIHAYRARYSQVKQWWENITDAFMTALKGDEDVELKHGKKVLLKFSKQDSAVCIDLPTGGRLWYHDVEETEDGDLLYTVPRGYPVKVTPSILAENICSFTSREIMAWAAVKLEKAGYPPIMLVHDEIVVEVPETKSPGPIKAIMEERPKWAPDLPLAVAGNNNLVRYGK